MAEPIDDVKSRLSKDHLGKSGVHGIGVSRSQGTLRIYVHSEPGADIEALRAQIAEEAKPYKIIVVEEERPGIT